jgi:hypothetical protein
MLYLTRRKKELVENLFEIEKEYPVESTLLVKKLIWSC